MNAGAAAATTRTAAITAAAGGSTAAAAPGSLLPEPAVSAFVGTEQGLDGMFAMLAKLSQLQAHGQETQVASKDAEEKHEVKLYNDAVARQHAEERRSHGFWAHLKTFAGTVGKIAALAAGVAAVVASGGAAAPLAVGVAALALSAGGTAVQELKLFGSASDKVGMWMQIGGAAVGLGGSLAAVAGLVNAGGESASTFASTLRLTAGSTQAAATGTGAIAGAVTANIQHSADEAVADQQAHTFAQERIERETKALIQALQEGSDATKDALDATRGALEATSQAQNIGIAGVKG